MSEDASSMDSARSPDLPARFTVNAADLASHVVATIAPEQLELLEFATVRWLDGGTRRRRKGWFGGAVGSGIEPMLTSDIIYPILTGAFAQLLGAAAVAGWRRRRRFFERAKHPDGSDLARMTVTLDSHQLDRFHSLCIRISLDLGLPHSRAAVLADAIIGGLHRAMLDTPPRG